MKKKLLVSLLAVGLIPGSSTFAQTIKNAGFETWKDFNVTYQIVPPKSVALSAPTSWQGSDSIVASFASLAALAPTPISIIPQKQVVKSSDVHGGTYAVALYNKNLGDVGIQPGSITNGSIKIDIIGLISGGSFDPSKISNFFQFKGGEPITQKVESVSAWMKNGDSVNVNKYTMTAMVTRKITDDSFAVLGQGSKSIDPTLTAYTEVTVNITYTDSVSTPTHLVVAFASGDLTDPTPLVENNCVLVDDVTYKLAAKTDIRIPLMTSNEMLVYPTPATNMVHFNLKSDVQPSAYTLTITDMNGRVISTEQLNNQINAKNVADWVRGMYFYQLTNTQTQQQQNGKFILK